MEEKRIFQRVLFSHDAKLICNGESHTVQVLDLSMHGFLCTQPSSAHINLNDEATLIMTLEQGRKIVMESTVVHIENSHLGMDCHHIDIDSVSELKRLIQLNLANDELLNRDLGLLAR
ncbi:PilZ domain-containing protein [Psychrobium sp. MM17-31]|uniref:PilZ domain-containing protein n=1 Tax=Psychrobium sp. MM17-31 TaxID=2917758 RepID=UPI001EF4CA84|nr:PilZ domain-containing protein [Psychrobium sp. MM17-31]MCG7530829.1 PilZ domain-containing protein [Psychrobium sp. MM17-31]